MEDFVVWECRRDLSVESSLSSGNAILVRTGPYWKVFSVPGDNESIAPGGERWVTVRIGLRSEGKPKSHFEAKTMGGIRDLLHLAIQRLESVPFEAVFWAVGLVAVALMDPEGGMGLNLCLFEQLGVFCPGDGLGRGIAHLVRGQVTASWAAHPLAGPVVLVLLFHITMLCRRER